MVYGLIYNSFQPISIQGSNHPAIINWVVKPMNADWLTAVVYQIVYHGYDKIFISFCNQFLIAIRDLWGLWYMANIPWLSAVSRQSAMRHAWEQPLVVGHIPHTPRAVLLNYKMCGSIPEYWWADNHGISESRPRVCQSLYFYCSNYIGNQFIIAIRCLGGLWYMANVPRLRSVSRHSALHRAYDQPLAMVFWL
jgi:hypothetical protein